jgi:hypothetical protein
VSVCEPQTVIRIRSGHPDQWELRSRAAWDQCQAAWTAFLISAPPWWQAGGTLTPGTETRSSADEHAFDPMHTSARDRAGERQRSGKRFHLRALSRIFAPADDGCCRESS